MRHEISYEYSPELARRGTQRFISAYAGPWLVAFAIAAALALVGVIAGKEPVFCWGVIILWAVQGLPWLRYYKASIKKCEEMTDRKVTLRAEPEGLSFQTSLYSSTLKWAAISCLYIYPDLLLVFFDKTLKTAYTILPVAALDEETMNFIKQQVREHGGKVLTPNRSRS